MAYFMCCICKTFTEGIGNNPDPVKKEGVYCDRCNMREVIPARVKMAQELVARNNKNEKKKN